MLILRGTKKLRDRLKTAPVATEGDTSTTLLGDWFATALFWKPQAVLVVNRRTLLPVFLPLAPAATLVDRIPDAIADALRAQGVPEGVIASELDAMGEVRVAPTDDRSTVGVMNEYAFHGETVVHLRPTSLDELSLTMSNLLIGPLMKKETGSSDRELAAVVAELALDDPTTPGPGSSSDGGAEVIDLASHRAGGGGPAGRAGAAGGQVFQLKVALAGIRPPIWRRLLSDGATTLDDLHDVIQVAFGWYGYHLHDFEIGGRQYGVPDPDWDFGPPRIDERKTRLDAVASEGSTFRYIYDFGDWWEHKITVEKVLPDAGDAGDVELPALIKGKRACPPEDCGGPWGYGDLLEILADPKHPEHAERIEWLGQPFDPEEFDPSRFAEDLAYRRTAPDDGW